MIITPGDLEEAAICYLRRKDRLDNPEGEMRKSAWFPVIAETRNCCATMYQPNGAFPYTLQKHCRTVPHIAQLFSVDPVLLRRAIKEVQTNPRFSDRLK
jgi:hypothetical protein